MDFIKGLVDWLGGIWDQVNPFVVLYQYESGIHMRLGKKVKDLPVGLSFLPLKILFIDSVLIVHNKRDTYYIENVNITTKDNKTVSIGAVIEFEIINPTLYLLEANDSLSNAKDISKGIIADYLVDCEWDEIKQKTTRTDIKRRISRDLEEIGIKVRQVLFTNIVTSRAFTIFKD